jgi:hypothetical protein
VHAKVADHAQRHAEESDPMADANSSGGLTEKTVAVPFSSSSRGRSSIPPL